MFVLLLAPLIYLKLVYVFVSDFIISLRPILSFPVFLFSPAEDAAVLVLKLKCRTYKRMR